MVYNFLSTTVDPPAVIYVGKDKFENEELIKYGWEEDVCAHVYLRLQPGQHPWTWDTLPAALVEDCAQLTKANSIEGNKQDNVRIIYTPWSNLRKTASMATGQTKKTLLPTRLNSTINRLTKTRTITPTEDLPAAREEHLKAQRAVLNKEKRERIQKEEREVKILRDEKEKREKAYRDLMDGVGGEEYGDGDEDEDGEGGRGKGKGKGSGGIGRSNTEGWDEDDFM